MPAISNDVHSSVPPKEGDTSPDPALALFPALFLPVLLIVVLAIFLGPALGKLIRHFRPPNPEENSDPESSGSSSNASSGSRVVPGLDSIAPPKTCNKMREQLEARAKLPPWASLSSLAVCAICLDIIKDADLVRHLPCEHNFHSTCISQWFMRRHDTCPICSIHLMPPSPGQGRPAQG